MANHNRHQARRTNENALTQLAFGFDGNSPPGGRARVAAASPPQEPTLTEIFNKAAKKPVLHDASKGGDYQQKIDALRRQMSKNVNTYEMSPLGTIHSSINRDRDHWLFKTMTALQQEMSKGNDQQKRLGLAAQKGEAKKQFNRAAKGMGM